LHISHLIGNPGNMLPLQLSSVQYNSSCDGVCMWCSIQR